jgi:hypothetical protein
MPTYRVRRLAVHVLLVWLFALTTGIVNACVVTVASIDAAALVATEAKVQHPGGHHHESDHVNPPCERFCDESSVIPPAAKQQGDFENGSWPAMGPVSSPFQPRASFLAKGALDSESIRWRATIPFSIAFLRLNL